LCRRVGEGRLFTSVDQKMVVCLRRGSRQGVPAAIKFIQTQRCVSIQVDDVLVRKQFTHPFTDP
jgi:hypothetical protein